VAAHAEHRGAEDGGDDTRGHGGKRQADREAFEILHDVEGEDGLAAALGGVVLADRIEQPDLDERAGVHADADEDDVAEGVVAHLAADQIPGQGKDDEQPELGHL